MLDKLNYRFWAQDIVRCAKNQSLISDEEKAYWLSTPDGQECLKLLAKIKAKQAESAV